MLFGMVDGNLLAHIIVQQKESFFLNRQHYICKTWQLRYEDIHYLLPIKSCLKTPSKSVHLWDWISIMWVHIIMAQDNWKKLWFKLMNETPLFRFWLFNIWYKQLIKDWRWSFLYTKIMDLGVLSLVHNAKCKGKFIGIGHC
jgi:hypothetical protein